jgi:hypothetical protein
MKLNKLTYLSLLIVALGFSALVNTASARTYHWHGLQIQMSRHNAKIFISRLERTNHKFQQLVAKASRKSPVVVKVSDKNAPSGGNYTATNIDGDGFSFEVGLNPKNFRLGNQLGYHLEAHELSHIIANSYSDNKVYDTYFNFWHRSPAWRDCFPQKSPPAMNPCVPIDEIFADQLAFWATGNGKVRSSYKLPPLASHSSMNRLARSSGLLHNAGLR